MDNVLRCYICNKTDERGIILLNEYICRECELSLIEGCLDEFNYEKIRRSVKRIWKGVSINTTVENF